MKIGIFTFHCAHNYGAMLQAYALQTYLISQGNDAYIVDYRPKYFFKFYRPHSWAHWLSKKPSKTLKKLISEPFLFRERTKRWNAFNEFHLNKYKLYDYNKIKESKFDLLIFGSDQIWNKQLTNNSFDDNYWATGFNCPCISYAASMGNKPSEEDFSTIARLLKNFKHISVRESDLVSQLSVLINKPISLTCDPVFLLSKEEWANICTPLQNKKPYVLCYNLQKSQECRNVAEMISNEKGYEIKEIIGYISYDASPDALLSIGPAEFISYFLNASFIVTSSFHGTAFSLIFEKNFYTVGVKSAKGRITSLLTMLGLQNRMHSPKSSRDITSVDYLDANKRLEAYINMSMEYLNSVTTTSYY